MSPYCIIVCVPTRLSAVRVTILHYSVCASKAICSSCHHTAIQCVSASKADCSSCNHNALQCVCQQGCLQFMSTYCVRVCVCQQGCLQFMSPHCITVCVPATLSTGHVTILHYSVCASNTVCSSCHYTALKCLCQQGCLKFMSPYCITVCVPARQFAVRVTIHIIINVCAIKAVSI